MAEWYAAVSKTVTTVYAGSSPVQPAKTNIMITFKVGTNGNKDFMLFRKSSFLFWTWWLVVLDYDGEHDQHFAKTFATLPQVYVYLNREYGMNKYKIE